MQLIIRLSLLLLFAALMVLLSADLLLGLALPVLPELITRVGLAFLFSGFALLLASGLLFVGKHILYTSCDYFSSRQRLHRKLLFMQARQDQLKRLFEFKTAYIDYFNDLQRKHLLAVNNRKHIQLLSKAIDRKLLSVKQQLPRATYLQFRRENNYWRNRQNAEALLKLQQKILSLD